MSELSALFTDKQRAALCRDQPTPLYHQLYRFLRNTIVDGRLNHGSRMPTEKELSREFGVSRITSRRAMEELAREGLVVRQPGKGTFVSFKRKASPVHAPMVGMLQEIESIGRVSRARVVDCSMLHPPVEIRAHLGLPEGGKALYLARVRHRDGKPFGYYTSWTTGVELPADPSVLERTPRMTYFRTQGLRVAFIRQTLDACSASEEAAELLGMETGAAILRLTRLAYVNGVGDANPVDYLQVLYNPRRFEYRIDLELDNIPSA
jgi:GntR family transcriptional regulator